MSRLEGRVALVTGAGQGSGRGCALALAAEGARVALLGRTRSKLSAVAEEIESRGGSALPLRCDVTDRAQIQSCVEKTVSELGGLHILVNSAQSPTLRSGTLLDMAPEVVNELWLSGPVATLECMRAAYPHLRGGGSIVNFGTGAQFAPAGFGMYAAAKAAIQTLTRGAAEEWGPEGIRANTVIPFVVSPAFDEELPDGDPRREALRQTIPLRRFGNAEHDLGRAVVFLAGPDSSYVTGTTLMVDGGMAFLR